MSSVMIIPVDTICAWLWVRARKPYNERRGAPIIVQRDKHKVRRRFPRRPESKTDGGDFPREFTGFRIPVRSPNFVCRLRVRDGPPITRARVDRVRLNRLFIIGYYTYTPACVLRLNDPVVFYASLSGFRRRETLTCVHAHKYICIYIYICSELRSY